MLISLRRKAETIMCGINGILLKNYDLKIDSRIAKMNQSLLHRGPDAGNVIIIEDGKIAIGHRRLSIIDLNDRSTQPMISASGRWILSYNGEIYNFQDLKAETDYPYKTTSDTEVVLAYLECYGIDALLKVCNGMYAFAAYDTWENTLYLCRDRFGIKPFYYYHDSDKIIFSSEIKGILASGLVNAVLDEESIDDYLGYRYVREPYTFFQGILQVKAGTYLRISKEWQGQEEEIRYWDIPKVFNVEENYDETAVKKAFGEHLQNAVLKRTIADVPLGTYLSGGIDSSLLTALVAENSKHRVNTYTIGFQEMNEFEFARLVSDKYKTLHHEILMSRMNYLDMMKEVITYKDAPLGVPNEVPLAAMSRELKKDITVVLSGEGADELLGGYGRIFRAPFDYANEEKQESFYDYFIRKYEYVPREIRNEFLIAPLKRRNFYDESIRQRFEEMKNEYNVFYFFHKYHVKGLLQRVDTTTMLASVEARVPFLDHELVEYVYEHVPYQLKLHWKSGTAMQEAKGKLSAEYSEILDSPKYLLRQMAYDYLPIAVVDRKKVGFPVPLGQWNDNLQTMLHKWSGEGIWIKAHSVEKLIDKCGQHPIGNQILWMFINMGLFYEIYFTKDWRW